MLGGDPARDAIARDLEVLLNCRRPANLVPEGYSELSTSIFNFGIPEFDQFGKLASLAEQNRLCSSFEAAIRLFEPRLRNVSVRLSQPGPGGNLRFHIEAQIKSTGEGGIFEAGVQRNSTEISVTGRGGA